VESTLGSGSTLTFRIPASIEENNSSSAASEKSLVWNTDEAPLIATNMSSINTVLVIDDDPSTRDLLERSLSAVDLSVVTADNGEDGILLAQALRPDIVILDVVLPDKDGWEVLAALKSDPELMNIPAIMLTIVDERGKGMGLGATEYLIKPIDSEQLVKVVRSNLWRNSYTHNNDVSLPDGEDASALCAEAQLTF
jgi:DNA-binding response OmpR family regulator